VVYCPEVLKLTVAPLVVETPDKPLDVDLRLLDVREKESEPALVSNVGPPGSASV